MKIISLILIFICSHFILKAQPPAAGSNIINNHLNKFEGNWQWVSGTDTLTLKMKKYNTVISNYSEDILMGSHQYVRNGILVETSMGRFDSIALNHKKTTIFLYQNSDTDTSKVFGSFKDLTKKKTNNLYLELVNGTPPTIIWHLETAEGAFINPNFQYGLTMPKDIILTKQ